MYFIIFSNVFWKAEELHLNDGIMNFSFYDPPYIGRAKQYSIDLKLFSLIFSSRNFILSTIKLIPYTYTYDSFWIKTLCRLNFL